MTAKSGKRGPHTGPRFIRPLGDFLHTESAGGVLLVVATVIALVWANSPWQTSYTDFWSTHVAVSLGSHTLDLTLQGWINDGLMTLFFFVVGLEIKRELVEGELREPRRAALPAIAAARRHARARADLPRDQRGHAREPGWGIPIATDIAMAVGVLSLLGSRIAPSLKLFLLALAIVDDIGAILVIAIFYSHGIHLDALGVAALLVVAVVVARAHRRLVHAALRRPRARVVARAARVRAARHDRRRHPRPHGADPPDPPARVRRRRHADRHLDRGNGARNRGARRESVSVVEWLEQLLHPWTSFVIVPLFALANAGIPLGATAINDAFSSRLTYGVLVGLVVGKLVGITFFTWLAVRIGVGSPAGRRAAGADRRRCRARRDRLHGFDLRRLASRSTTRSSSTRPRSGSSRRPSSPVRSVR